VLLIAVRGSVNVGREYLQSGLDDGWRPGRFGRNGRHANENHANGQSRDRDRRRRRRSHRMHRRSVGGVRGRHDTKTT